MKLFSGQNADPKNPRAHCRFERSNVQHQSLDYGVTDNKGRAVGGIVRTWVETYHDDETGDSLIPVEKLGRSFFMVSIGATRDGAAFGARGIATPFAEAAEARQHVDKITKRARARARKIHAPT